ncbi:MAG: RNA polymerase sigma factor [Phycisphaerae bacterium]
MPPDEPDARRRGARRMRGHATGDPPDGFLIESAVAGDAAALRELMRRYDRLVRLTVFRVAKGRCLRDPQWLDAVASDTWSGFLRSMTRPGRTVPDSLGPYLIQTARFRCTSALRAATKDSTTSLDDVPDDVGLLSDRAEDPADVLIRVEEQVALRACMDDLSDDDRRICAQITPITDRRWRDAAAALGIAESTLRTRWRRITERLKRCVERKTRDSAAPDA